MEKTENFKMILAEITIEVISQILTRFGIEFDDDELECIFKQDGEFDE